MGETKSIIVVGIVLLVSVAFLAISLHYNPINYPNGGFDEYGKFNSVEELRAFLEENMGSSNYYFAKGVRTFAAEESSDSAPSAALDMDGGQAAGGSDDYSQTNVQVEGVDEPDIVKNDGKYIYAIAGNKVVIVNAFPATEMEIVSELEFDENVRNIFVNEDKLVVFTEDYQYVDTGLRCGDVFAWGIRCGGYSKQDVVVYVYDISDRENPEEEDKVSVDGNYMDARMIGDYVYLVSSKYVQLNYFDLPSYSINGEKVSIAADEIYYFNQNDESFVFNTISALDLDNGDFETETYLMGYSGSIYVSEDNVYLTYRKELNQMDIMGRYLDEVLLPELPGGVAGDIKDVWESDESYDDKEEEIGDIISDYMGELDSDELFEFQDELEDKAFDFFKVIEKEQDKTVIHKVSVDELDIGHEAVGEVPGRVLNQFSMDEYGGNFRIATTTGGWDRDENENGLYILDEALELIGEVDGLAEGETIYSARFMGDKAYMVTFRQVDPLFVVDLSNPEEPEVVGELKVTGYSGYLHPYDENHLLGIGMEANENGRVQGVKISLFDVSDMNNPVEIDKYEISEGEWSSSDAVNEHKAVLFDKEKNLLVIPVSYNSEKLLNGRYVYDYWQGAYVFDVSLEGIDLKGKIAHEEGEEDEWYGRAHVRRSLYIDDVLYTISNAMIKSNELADLSFVSEVELPYGYADRPVYAYGVDIDDAVLE